MRNHISASNLASARPATPASQKPDGYYGLQSRVTAFRGIESGHRHAEAYIRHVSSAGDLLPAGSVTPLR